MSITPSPIMPRSFSRSVVGVSQSHTWKASSRALAGARDLLLQLRVPPAVVHVQRHAQRF
jgi:hypothetical protein